MPRRPTPARLGLALAAGLALPLFALAPGATAAGAAGGAVPGTDGVARRGAVAQAAGHDRLRTIVRSTGRSAADLDATVAAVRAAGARVVAVQPSLGTLVADVPVAQGRAALERMAASPVVRAVAPDVEVHAQSLGGDASGEQGSLDLVARVVGATELWRRGITGAGVGVALVDTGVAPVTGLLGAGKVVVGPDLSFESQNPALRNLDTYGHGTHMAGIIAGREGPKAPGFVYAQDTSNFYGIAPDATLVSLKLADHYGAVDVSQVIAAIDWVVQHRDDTGVRIKVMNLSFGTPSQQAPWQDPLSYAAGVAADYGITVVAAAGNNGANGYGLNDPAYNRNVIAVGSSSTSGTEATDDDDVPWFSARKGGAAWWRNPDVVAPGVGIVSLRVPGSYVAQTYPGAAVGQYGIRGSGTSQSTAVVSGAAALLLQQRPWLTPAQVKWLLMQTANKLPRNGTWSAGAGSIDVARAARTWWVGSAETSDGLGHGSLEQARGGVHVSDGTVELRGEVDIMGRRWSPFTTAEQTAAAQMWTADGMWNGAFWTGPGFVADDGDAWSGRTWAGRTWTGRTWSGRTWAGRTWTDAHWDPDGGIVASGWPDPQPGDDFAAELWGTATWDPR